MPVTSIKTVRPVVWIPPGVRSAYKVEIISGGNVYDVTGYIEQAKIKQALNPDAGSFEIVILNPNDKFKGVFSADDKVKLYKDYGNTATTLRFQGVVESVDESNHRVKLKGKSLAKELLDYTIAGTYTDQTVSSILLDIISKVNDEIAEDFTTNNVDTSGSGATQTISISFNHKSAWECIEMLCKIANYDFYVDENKDCHFFAEKSVNNDYDAAVHNFNILKVKSFEEDASKVRNKIIVYGATIDNIPIVYTTSDSESINKYGLREEVINDGSIESYEEAQHRGDAELLLKKDPPIIGEIVTTLLVGLKPGEMLRVSYPQGGIAPNRYKILEFEDSIKNNSIPQTKIKLVKWKPTLPQIFRDIYMKQKETTQLTNPHKLEHVYLFTFDDNTNIAELTNLEISDGYLIVSSGSSSGTMVTAARNTGNNVSKFELRAEGDNIAGNVNYYVSVDNGITWQSVSRNTLTTPTSEGNHLMIKVILNSADAKIDTLGVLYST